MWLWLVSNQLFQSYELYGSPFSFTAPRPDERGLRILAAGRRELSFVPSMLAAEVKNLVPGR